MSALILNVELIRTYNAIKIQFGAVAGTPVPWNLLGYLAHAFSIHGGSWDVFQWSGNGSQDSTKYEILILSVIIVLGVILISFKRKWLSIIKSEYLPITLLALMFLIGLVYYRYLVPSPFAVGIGQSWSQFKLVDWAGPFMMIFIIVGLASTKKWIGKSFNKILLGLVILGIIFTYYTSISRYKIHIAYYGTNDLNQYYLDFRKAVNLECTENSPIYLNFDDHDLKFKEMLGLYLYDRELKSNWLNDSYISDYLTPAKRAAKASKNDCIIERIKEPEAIPQGSSSGNFRIYYK
jgi:hypothetical protein